MRFKRTEKPRRWPLELPPVPQNGVRTFVRRGSVGEADREVIA